MIILSAFEPGIFFLLLWGLLSWFTSNKKKKKIRTDMGEVVTKPKPKEDLFARIQKLQEHLSTEVKIFPESPRSMEAEDDYSDEMDESGFEEPEILKPTPKIIDETEQYVYKTDIKAPTTEHDNWLKQNLFRKSELKRLIVLKEVLTQPRSLKPYAGDYFQS